MNYSALENSGIGLSFWSDEPLSPRSSSFRILVFFRYRRYAGACGKTEYYCDLLRENLCKCMGLVFAMDQDFFEKWISPKTEI